MVDSESNTSLPSVSRRELLAGAAATGLLTTAVSSQRAHEKSDSILALWQEWRRLHTQATSLCRRWQEIETHLMHKIGFPQVRIPSSDNPHGICAQSHAEIDRALVALPCFTEIAATLHADLTAHQARWDAEAARVGFDEIKRQEDDAWSEEAQASAAIFHARATCLAGIQIKIALIIELCSTGSDDPELPLPQLRSTLADVKRLRRAADALQC